MPPSSRIERRKPEAHLDKMEERPTGRNESVGLLNTIDKSLDDMRAIITCRVCVRPLYEPFTIECGHTFCYTCLVSWFEKNTANKTCPDCRAKITRTPAPAYLIREITQLFSNRAELLPAGETTQEHQDHQREEAKVLEDDRHGRGLFRGGFRHDERPPLPFEDRIIIDDEDGVNRCPRCTWEVEDGECAGCGWPGGLESWEDDSLISVVSDDGLMLQEMPLERLPARTARRAGVRPARRPDGSDTDASTEPLRDASSDQGASNDSDDMNVSEDESVGSLNEFVVQDEQDQGTNNGLGITRRRMEWMFPGTRHRSRGEVSSGTDSSGASNVASLDTFLNRTNAQRLQRRRPGEIDLDTTEGSSAEGLVPMEGSSQSEDSSSVRENRLVVNLSDDEEVIPFNRRTRNHGRRGPNQVNAISGPGSRSSPSNVVNVSSDSDGPLVRNWARRRRNNPGHILSNNGNLTSTRNLRLNATARSGAAIGSTDTDEDDADDDDENTMRREPPEQVSEHEPSLIVIGDSEDAPAAQAQSNERTSRSRLDPTTSLPARRENVNMPGAFPPSFVSEQGQSQPTPFLDYRDYTDQPPPPSRRNPTRHDPSPSPRLDPVRRNSQRDQGQDSTFLVRRRQEERTHDMLGDRPNRRERSAAKSARRQSRQRVKAEQEARNRRNGEPSIPPSTTS